jgi:hypothetical protein
MRVWTNVEIGAILLLVVVFLWEGVVGQLGTNARLRRAHRLHESIALARVAGETA